MIVVVTGLPRSGTTCMMRMLEAGGIEPYYDTHKPLEWRENSVNYINYNIILRETDKINDLAAGNGDWLKECEGKAVKILNPAKVVIPPGPEYRFIWMDRKIKHMARSNKKYLLRSGRKNVPDHRLVINNAREARTKGMALLKDYPQSRFMTVSFEQMLKKPKAVAVRVSQFLEINMNTDRMAAVVVRRPAFCLPVMMEENIYLQPT